MESEATSSGFALALGIFFSLFGVVFLVVVAVQVGVTGWNWIQKILDKRLSQYVRRLEDQRKTLALAVIESLEIIDKLGPEGWEGLDRPERSHAECGVDHLRSLAKNHDPNKRLDCLILP